MSEPKAKSRAFLITVIPVVLAFFPWQDGHARQPQVPPVTTNNKNALILEYRTKLKLNASSTWNGWPPANAVDGNPQSSWFSARGDTAAQGKSPWLEVEFPVDVRIKRITILGNRDPAWLKGYTILAGRLEVFDAGDKLLWSKENDGFGPASDFDFMPPRILRTARRVRFTALGDQGKQNPHNDIAVGEIQVE